MKPFTGVSAEAFAAYSPEKWSSNVHNLARMKVKDALVALAERVHEALRQELAGLERGVSDEVPSFVNQKKVDAQWIFWFRDATARGALASFLERIKLDQSALLHIAPQDKHAALAVVLRQGEVWVGLHVAAGASVDRKNFHAKLGKGWERERMLELCKELPEGATICFGGGREPVARASLAILEQQAADIVGSSAPWQLGHALSAEEAQKLGPDLADHMARWLGAFVPLYRFLAWTRDNDHIEAGKQLQEEKQQKRRQAVAYNAGDRVRIISGVFSGKIGVVQEIDTKAQVKVRVGKMSVVVAGSDLTPAT